MKYVEGFISNEGVGDVAPARDGIGPSPSRHTGGFIARDPFTDTPVIGIKTGGAPSRYTPIAKGVGDVAPAREREVDMGISHNSNGGDLGGVPARKTSGISHNPGGSGGAPTRDGWGDVIRARDWQGISHNAGDGDTMFEPVLEGARD